MIKKILVILTIACFVCSSFLGCGSNKPDNINETLYRKAQKVVEITEKYLDTDLTAEEASKRIERLSSQIDASDDNYNLDEQSIASSITLLKVEFENAKLSQDEGDYSEDKDIQDTINNLKEKLKGE